MELINQQETKHIWLKPSGNSGGGLGGGGGGGGGWGGV